MPLLVHSPRSLSESCHILQVSWARGGWDRLAVGRGRSETPGWAGLSSRLGSVSRAHVSGPRSPDAHLTVWGRSWESALPRGPQGGGCGRPVWDTLLPGHALSLLCLAPCQAGPGTVAGVCVNTLRPEQTSVLRYAIRSPGSNACVLVIAARSLPGRSAWEQGEGLSSFTPTAPNACRAAVGEPERRPVLSWETRKASWGKWLLAVHWQHQARGWNLALVIVVNRWRGHHLGPAGHGAQSP